MNLDLYRKKQVVFPQVITRIMTLLIEVILLLTLITAPMQQAGLFLFKLNFADFIAANHLELNTVEDIRLFYASQVFSKQELVSFPSTWQTFSLILEFLFLQFLALSVYFIFCWNQFGTTFCKYILKIKVVDYETGKKPKLYNCIIRYLSYLLFPISIFMVAFGKEKRALHDIIAGTIVIKN